MSDVVRILMHEHETGEQGAFLEGAYDPIYLWLSGWARKPLYAIKVKLREVNNGDRHQEER